MYHCLNNIYSPVSWSLGGWYIFSMYIIYNDYTTTIKQEKVWKASRLQYWSTHSTHQFPFWQPYAHVSVLDCNVLWQMCDVVFFMNEAIKMGNPFTQTIKQPQLVCFPNDIHQYIGLDTHDWLVVSTHLHAGFLQLYHSFQSIKLIFNSQLFYHRNKYHS